MLDVITDFWKPAARKAAPEEKPVSLDELKVGCVVGFGFVPQAYVSGRRLTVASINTYQFGEERLVSYVFAPQTNDVAVSMIVAQTGGEKYLALSRRVSTPERAQLFDGRELDAAIDKLDAKSLRTKDGGEAFKGWLVPNYTKQIQGLKGKLSKGDARSGKLTDTQEFDYFLLVSDSNEHAIEIEKYADGRLEIYATVYRRTTDIGQVSASEEDTGPFIPMRGPSIEATKAELKITRTEPAAKELPKETPKESKLALISAKETAPAAQATNPSTHNPSEKKPMNLASDTFGKADNFNGAAKHEPKENAMQTDPNDAIECDLKVANKVIEEAIRAEMRLSDVVRRIVELPVAHQEAVQLPITLTDEDFKLLAIRYGIPSADKEAIKRRIADDLNDFSGGKKKVA